MARNKKTYFTIAEVEDRLEYHVSRSKREVKDLNALSRSVVWGSRNAGYTLGVWLQDARALELTWVWSWKW